MHTHVGDSSVKSFDTCGMDWWALITETVLDFMITNTSAVLCMDMYEQLDESTLEKIWKNNSLLVPYSRSSVVPTCHIGMTEEKFN